jgi:glutamine synthetase
MYDPTKTVVNPAPGKVAPFTVPAEDRNRTSPFPYGGHRFEFRAVGSTQNVSMVNTVLCTAIASYFDEMATAIIKGNELELAAKYAPALRRHGSIQRTASRMERPWHATPKTATRTAVRRMCARRYLEESWPIIFNGDGYGASWPSQAAQRGLHIENSNPEAIQNLTVKKNVELFEKMNVMSKDETLARAVRCCPADSNRGAHVGACRGGAAAAHAMPPPTKHRARWGPCVCHRRRCTFSTRVSSRSSSSA